MSSLFFGLDLSSFVWILLLSFRLENYVLVVDRAFDQKKVVDRAFAWS